jgi:hypothetical protein
MVEAEIESEGLLEELEADQGAAKNSAEHKELAVLVVLEYFIGLEHLAGTV